MQGPARYDPPAAYHGMFTGICPVNYIVAVCARIILVERQLEDWMYQPRAGKHLCRRHIGVNRPDHIPGFLDSLPGRTDGAAAGVSEPEGET